MKYQNQLSGIPEAEATTEFQSSPRPATRVFVSLSDAETDVSSDFGEDLKRNEWT